MLTVITYFSVRTLETLKSEDLGTNYLCEKNFVDDLHLPEREEIFKKIN